MMRYAVALLILLSTAAHAQTQIGVLYNLKCASHKPVSEKCILMIVKPDSDLELAAPRLRQPGTALLVLPAGVYAAISDPKDYASAVAVDAIQKLVGGKK
jgi:hypothetical protein